MYLTNYEFNSTPPVFLLIFFIILQNRMEFVCSFKDWVPVIPISLTNCIIFFGSCFRKHQKGQKFQIQFKTINYILLSTF